MRPLKIISGGQTGVDQAALRAARAGGLETGGWAPRGWRTDEGPNPELGSVYGLIEAPYASYSERTRLNVRDSDATLIIAADHNSPGVTLTRSFCGKLFKPVFSIALIRQLDLLDPTGVELDLRILKFIRAFDVKVLNVAGNRDRHFRKIGDRTEALLLRFFARHVAVEIKNFTAKIPVDSVRDPA